MPLYKFPYNVPNVLVQIANKMGLQKNILENGKAGLILIQYLVYG
jgi:hypothetical protein